MNATSRQVYPISLLVNETDLFLWQVASGKLPKKNPTHSTDESITRINQAAQKGPTCWFYASKPLWPAGENACKKQFSSFRKEISFLDDIHLFSVMYFRKCHLVIKIKNDVIHFPQITLNSKIKWDHPEILVTEAQGYLSKYLLSPPIQGINENTFNTFIQEHINRKIYHLSVNYIRNFSKDLSEDLLQRLRHSFGFINNEIKDQALEIMPSILANFFKNILLEKIYAKLHFVTSSWSTNDSLSNLIDELKKYGPMLATGSFGQNYHSSKPCELPNRIKEHTIWKWKTKDFQPDTIQSHMVVLVGADTRNGKQYIYYINPNDASPSEELRKMYRLSFKQFTESFSFSNPIEKKCLIYQSNLPNFKPLL